MNLRLKLQGTIGRAFLLGAMAFTAVSYGQIRNFSGVRDIGRDQEAIDLSISMKHRTLDEIKSNPALKAQYEQVIGYWADGVYEMTNGGHKLGKIRIFTGGDFFDNVDVQWVDTIVKNYENSSGAPNAHLNGFLQQFAGLRLEMCDLFLYSIPTVGNDWDLKAAGYTLAHETGHYIYALFDEYDVTTGQVIKFPGEERRVPSIMNSQWPAAYYGNLEYLNFSTSNFNSIFAQTNQLEFYGEDAWTVLANMDPANDPYLARSYYYGTRNKYDVLKNRKPTSQHTYNGYSMMKIELPTEQARNQLQIIWMEKTLNIDLALDISNSMNALDGVPVANMKEAALAFVDAINFYKDFFDVAISIGITTFNSKVETTNPIVLVDNNSIDIIKSKIENIVASGNTAMYDACLTSLDKLTSHPSIGSNRITMLFTDGAENHSKETNVSNVIKQFNDNHIPIYTFGYGDGVSHENCKNLSAGTKGTFSAYLTDNDAIYEAWENILGDMTDLEYLTIKPFSVADGLKFTVDPTVYSGIVEVSYTLENVNSSCAFTITDQNGGTVSSTTTAIPLGNSSIYPQKQIALISIDNNAVAGANLGEWKLNVASSGLVSTDLNGKVRIKGKPEGTYAVAVGNYHDGFYTWPQPLRLSAATTGKHGLITGLNVAATLTTPSGSVINVVLNDNGVSGDEIAHDGIYSLDYSGYDENGQYTLSVQFDNSSINTAYYTKNGTSVSLPNGSSGVNNVHVIDTLFATEDFVRVKTTVFHIDGVNAQPPTRTGSIMGFESDTLWHIVYSSGTLASSTVRTQGKASLQIAGNGWQQIKSDDINTDELRNVTNNLSVDLYMGDTQTNPHWTGQVQLFVNCPSANIYNQYIGLVELTGLPLDVFSTLSFTLPQGIVDVLNGSCSDFSFSLSINTNAFTGAYYFDNMRFGN